MRKLIYLLLFIFNISYAQEVLTTEMAVKLTLENNLDIQVSENFLEISKMFLEALSCDDADPAQTFSENLHAQIRIPT